MKLAIDKRLFKLGGKVSFELTTVQRGTNRTSLKPNRKDLKEVAARLGITTSEASRAISEYNWGHTASLQPLRKRRDYGEGESLKKKNVVRTVSAELIDIARDLMSASTIISRSRVAIRVGERFENDAIRVHRWGSAIRVWDLTNAGRRGKKVKEISIYDLDYAKDASSEIEAFANKITKARSYAQAVKMIMDAEKEINSVTAYPVKVDEGQERGVDVTPAGFKPIEVKGKYVNVSADYKTFSIRDKEDVYNEPTCIPAIKGGKRDIKVFYRWVKDNEGWLQNAHYREVVQAVSKAGIRFHSYCAVD